MDFATVRSAYSSSNQKPNWAELWHLVLTPKKRDKRRAVDDKVQQLRAIRSVSHESDY